MNNMSESPNRVRAGTALTLVLGSIMAYFAPVMTLLVALVLIVLDRVRGRRGWLWPTVAALAVIMLFVTPLSPLNAGEGIRFIPLD